jgi:hypothetical protein
MTKESQIEESLIGRLTDLKYAEILQRAVLEIHTARTQRNLWDMNCFYVLYYQTDTKLRQAVAVLPAIKLDTYTLAQRQIKSNNFDFNS